MSDVARAAPGCRERESRQLTAARATSRPITTAPQSSRQLGQRRHYYKDLLFLHLPKCIATFRPYAPETTHIRLRKMWQPIAS